MSSANFELKMRSGVGDALRKRGGDEIETEAMFGGERPLGTCIRTKPGSAAGQARLPRRSAPGTRCRAWVAPSRARSPRRRARRSHARGSGARHGRCARRHRDVRQRDDDDAALARDARRHALSRDHGVARLGREAPRVPGRRRGDLRASARSGCSEAPTSGCRSTSRPSPAPRKARRSSTRAKRRRARSSRGRRRGEAYSVSTRLRPARFAR